MKPTHLKILEGNPGHRPLNLNEPKFEDINLVPQDLNKEEKQIWEYLTKTAPPGLFTTADLGELKIYCIAFCLHKEAHKKIKKEGAVLLSPLSGIPMKNPWVDILNKQCEIMIKSGSNLGLSPAARSKLSVDNKGPKKENLRFGSVIINEQKEKYN